MPNHCKNKLTLIGPHESVMHFVDRANATGHVWDQQLKPGMTKEELEAAKERTRSVLQFSAFVPVVNYSFGANYSSIGYRGERVAWGVKWGAYDERLVEVTAIGKLCRVTYLFKTAWKPPDLFLEKVSAMYPRVSFLLSYGEGSPTRGRWIINQGVIDRIVDGEESPNYHDESSPFFIENEDRLYEACEKWQNEYYETHDKWVNDAIFVSRLQKALAESA